MLNTVIILKVHAMRDLSDISDLPCIDFEQLPQSANLQADFPDSGTVPNFFMAIASSGDCYLTKTNK